MYLVRVDGNEEQPQQWLTPPDTLQVLAIVEDALRRGLTFKLTDFRGRPVWLEDLRRDASRAREAGRNRESQKTTS